jgi:hypothetical protein
MDGWMEREGGGAQQYRQRTQAPSHTPLVQPAAMPAMRVPEIKAAHALHPKADAAAAFDRPATLSLF